MYTVGWKDLRMKKPDTYPTMGPQSFSNVAERAMRELLRENDSFAFDLIYDVHYLHMDPSSRDFAHRTGRHYMNWIGMLQHKMTQEKLRKIVNDILGSPWPKNGKPLYVLLVCTKGVHRSQAMAKMVSMALRKTKVDSLPLESLGTPGICGTCEHCVQERQDDIERVYKVVV